MTRLVLAAALALATPVLAQTPQAPAPQIPAAQPPPMPQNGVVTAPQLQNYEVRGIVSQQAKHGLTVVTPVAGPQDTARLGGALPLDPHLVALEGRVDANAPIRRDGDVASISDIRAGDFVRATWDAEAHRFTRITATSPDRYLR